MTCKSCPSGPMEPTQVPRALEGLGVTGYAALAGVVLIVGAGVGWGLALMGEGRLDPRSALIGTSAVLIACTPLLIICARRMSVEKNVWRCTTCGDFVDRG